MPRTGEIFVLVFTVLVAAAILFGFLAFDGPEAPGMPERTAQQDQGTVTP
jgi:hypothetical protein